jgi:hypothetical protein
MRSTPEAAGASLLLFAMPHVLRDKVNTELFWKQSAKWPDDCVRSLTTFLHLRRRCCIPSETITIVCQASRKTWETFPDGWSTTRHSSQSHEHKGGKKKKKCSRQKRPRGQEGDREGWVVNATPRQLMNTKLILTMIRCCSNRRFVSYFYSSPKQVI